MTSFVFQVDDFALYRYFTGRYQTVRCAKVTCVRVQCPGRIQIGARHPPLFFAQIGNNCYFILIVHAFGPAPMFVFLLLAFEQSFLSFLTPENSS